jgi:ankyrin repeat protein
VTADIAGAGNGWYGHRSAIHYATDGNNRDLVVLLLAHGADATIKDLDGVSALSAARRANNAGMVEILNAGAEIRAHFMATVRGNRQKRQKRQKRNAFLLLWRCLFVCRRVLALKQKRWSFAKVGSGQTDSENFPE